MERFIDKYLDFPNSFNEIFDQIESIQIKNMSKKQKKQISQTISFVYSKVMDLLKNKFEFLTKITKNFFSNVINLMYGKIVLHHSHVTGEIIGFAHDFCNQKVRENKIFFLCLLIIFLVLISFSW